MTHGTELLQAVHLKLEEVPSGDTLPGLRLRLYPSASLHHAHSVGNEHIAARKCLGKEGILSRRVIRMGVDGIDKQFPLRQRFKLRLAAEDIQFFKFECHF